jgi:DNA-binding transcriptional ArsR family regulator
MSGSLQLRHRDSDGDDVSDEAVGSSASRAKSTERRDRPACGQREQRYDASDDRFASILELLEDEYARRILEHLAEGEMTASELVETCDSSKSTVYRRLNRLEENDLVREKLRVNPRGHHRKVFEPTLVQATFELQDGTPSVRVTVDAESSPLPPSHPAHER